MNKRKLIKRYWPYLLVLLMGALFLTKPTILTVENNQLANSGQVTNAVNISKKWESASYRNEDGYYYTFTVNGEIYSGHTFDEEKRPSDMIKIMYLVI